MKTILKYLFYLIASFILMFFLGAFSSDNSILQRVTSVTLSVCYCFAPIILSSIEATKYLMADKRNALLLSVSGLFFVFAITESLAYGIVSIWFLSAFLSSLFILFLFIHTINLSLKSIKN